MIQNSKKDIPEILQKNQLEWTARLVNLVKEYGAYDKIPEGIKNDAINKYRHDEIKNAVVKITEGKCIFCESYIEDVDYTNIEHFYPKSLYPKFTFKWSNLFPACRKCNIPKDNFDTKNNPFIHPINDNGEDYFEYDELKIRICQTAPDKQKALNTIDKCNLDRITLCRQHSEILLSFYEVEIGIEKEIQHYKELTQNASKIKSCMNILESVDNLKMQTKYNMPYAGFLRFVIKKSSVISEAISIINKHSKEIGLPNYYDFKWKISA
jgi:uncharacterized protein (TIGR02646 family)